MRTRFISHRTTRRLAATAIDLFDGDSRPKSKPSLVAAVVLQALLLILPASAWAAAAEDAQEIGVPQATEASVKGCFGAVLSPDEDRFYTVREGLLTQYQINPFKKIGTVAIDWEHFKERKYGGNCRVLITNDKSKLIIVYYDQIFLLDARTGHISNKVERVDGGSMGAAVINENELAILDTRWDAQAPRHQHGRRFFSLTIWDADTLKLKREIRDLDERFGFTLDDTYGLMTKIQGRFYLVNAKNVVVLNSKTYAPELTLKIRHDSHSPPFGTPKISKDFQKLYVSKVSEVTDHLTGKRTSHGEFKFSSVLVFDQKTREFRIENANKISRDELDPILVHSAQLSRNEDYVMFVSSGASALLANLNTSMRFRFTQYESGEAILIASSNNEPAYVQLTPGARKYLMMKNSAGQVVPINDATFTKHHKTEYRH